MTDNHELFTHALFVDGIVGIGFPHYQVAIDAERGGLAVFTGNQWNEDWAWKRPALEELPTPTLQELYTSLKLYEVTHAH